MKLLHLSDLHIGKKVNEFSMLEDQSYILEQILSMIDEHSPRGVLIAGDIYDKGIPTVDAVTLFDWFLTELHRRKMEVFMVSGNHDSSERIDFGGRIMKEHRIHIGGLYQGRMERITLEDDYGPLHFYLMPFVKPAMVRRYFEEVETYQEAVEAIIGHADIDESQRNLLVAHQFITSQNETPEQCDSEVVSIGSLDNIDVSVFAPFDYVALGHLHGAQRIGRDTVRYAGSPLKYSFSEAMHIKSVTMIEMKEKDVVSYSKLPLTPLRDMREIKGPIAKLTDPAVYMDGNTKDYIHAILTDEEEVYDAIGKLRSIYPNIMKLDFENSKTHWNGEAKLIATEVEEKNGLELFSDFFVKQNNVPMTEEQMVIMQKIFEEMAGENR